MSRKELKEPDAFLKAGAQATTWMERHTGTMGIVAAILLGAGAVAAIVRYSMERRDERAAQALGTTLAILSRPAQAGEVAETSASEPPFNSPKEKEEALKKALDQFRQQHKNTPASELATFTEASSNFWLGNYDAALAEYQGYLKKEPSTEALKWVALEGEGYAYEAKGQLDRALASFERLAQQNKTDFLVGMGSYHQGRILILQNKKEEAAKVFSQLTSEHPGTAAARMASERLKDLEKQGIGPPPPTLKPQPASSPHAAASHSDAG